MTTLARWARAEWGRLYAAVRGPLAERRWRAVPLAVGAVCLTVVLHLVHGQAWGYRFVQNAGGVRAADPLWPALLRTPLSLFVPALDLPVWGALVQILLVFGIAELCLGRWRTLALAYVATLAGTLKENLAGKEHLAAIMAVLVLCGVGEVRQRRSRDRAGSGSGAPPSQS
ncbi:hypothetical protein [Streptomyces iakyrus]|uniref:hypothetical protein n=1 Tax=Streptomyces iakyrus TaxID=68219 RepID=UPI00368F5567